MISPLYCQFVVMRNAFSGCPDEVLANIFASVPTKDRRADPSAHHSPRAPDPACSVARARSDGSTCTDTVPRRVQHLPLVCRQWRTVLQSPGIAWRSVHLHWPLSNKARNGSFFAFCSRMHQGNQNNKLAGSV